MSARCTEVLEEVRRVLLRRMSELPCPNGGREVRLLDVGCWDGEWTARYAHAVGGRAFGIEIFEDQATRARARGVEVAALDLESQPFPWPDGAMDVVIANQVLEHLKNVWLPMSEMFRVTRVGGRCVLAVPNLASLHNRVLLALGRQPSSIRTFGPHVRGFTFGEFRAFVEHGGGWEVERAESVGLYPLPAAWGRVPLRLWPGAGHTTVLVARKARDLAPPWSAWMRGEREQGIQTFYGS